MSIKQPFYSRAFGAASMPIPAETSGIPEARHNDR